MSQEPLILNSGIQTILPQLTTPQVVYLDFDGAETSYYNRALRSLFPMFWWRILALTEAASPSSSMR